LSNLPAGIEPAWRCFSLPRQLRGLECPLLAPHYGISSGSPCPPRKNDAL